MARLVLWTALGHHFIISLIRRLNKFIVLWTSLGYHFTISLTRRCEAPLVLWTPLGYNFRRTCSAGDGFVSKWTGILNFPVYCFMHYVVYCAMYSILCSISYSVMWTLSFFQKKTVVHFTPSGVAQLVWFFSKFQYTVYHALCGIL